MSSFVDRLRSTATTSREICVHGFDPDGDTTGWARLQSTLETPARGPARVTGVMIGIVEPSSGRRRDLDQAEAMVRAVYDHRSRLGGCALPTHVFVEAQQVYPTPDEDPRKRVAKANDLLRLAQVTGAVQAIAHAEGACFVRALLPATWKGQQQKDVTIATCMQRLQGVPIQLIRRGTEPPEQVDALRLDKLPGKLGHALDALGIALYGLDWLSRHEVPAS